MDECDSLSIDYRDSTNEKGGSGSKVTQTTRPPGAARAAAFGQTAAGKNGLKRMMQRFGALILLLSMLCGCAREKQVTSLCVPGGEQAASSNEEAAPEANGKTTQETENGQTRHLEYERLPLPGDLQLATALTAAGDTILAGGPAEEGPALWKQDPGGETEQLTLAEGADYLYALCADAAGGAWLLSGSVPARYFVPMGSDLLMQVEPEPEGRLMLTHYDESFAQEQTVPVSIQDAQQGARFFQLIRTKTGFCLLAGSQLILLDEQGAELARQTVDPNADGWLFAAMQRQGDTLLVLTRNVLGGADSELRQFDAQTLAPLGEEAVSRETTGLGLALDGGVLLCDDTGLCTMDMQTGQTQVSASARELGIRLEAEQLQELPEGYLLYTPNGQGLTFLRWEDGSVPEKTVLQLAIVTGGGEVSYDFGQMVQDFNTGQDRYRIEYETYSDSEYDTDAASLDVLRTQIMAGQGPDLFAFYDINGFNPPALRAEAVCADLLPLTVDFLTEENLLPGLYRLLEQDGAVYELPLTVQIDTLIAPARFVPEPGVTLEDLEQARAQMPEGWVPVDSWNTPGNLFGLCALFCIGAFTDRETATCRFDSQEFCDYLTWCKRWGGDGSTPDSPETTLVGLGWISSVSWLAGRGEYYAKTWGEQGYTYAGFPVESGSGSAYNILTSLGLGPQCSDLDGAKAFFAFCFSYQQENRIPANSALLRAEMDDFMAGNRTDWYGEVELLGKSDAAQFYALLETITVRTGQDRALEDILCEEAAAYFAGSISAEQAAQNIQSRAGIYLQEQYGS